MLLSPAAVSAAVSPKVDLTLSGAIVVTDGAKVSIAAMDRPVKAGETIRYTIVAKNHGSADAVGMTPVGNVPEQFTFARIVEAPPSAHAEYSLDRKTWSAHPTVLVRETDGKVRRVAAPLSLYRSVRWLVDKGLAPGRTMQFVYEARVN